MLLTDLVDATDAVGATSARKNKTQILADLLAATDPAEIKIVVGFLAGEPAQGRIGVGWATVSDTPPGSAQGPTLTVADLDTLLTAIAETEGPGSQDRRRDLLTTFFDAATAAESDFVRRLLIGELRQGANAGIVTDAIAKASGVPSASLRRAVMLSGDLGGAAATAATKGTAGLDAIRLEVMRPIQPMLASTAPTVADAIEALGTASVEWKLDGIRIQVHKKASQVRVWTRNLNDITERVPEVVAAVRPLDPESLVLDGEVLAFDDEGHPFAFQDTVSNDSTVTPFFFDLLLADDVDLVDAPLHERRALLVDIVGRLAIPGTITSDPADAQSVLDDALAAGHEGAVIKGADSTYQAGRRGKSWRKVKPVHTLDLVVLAVEHGSGRRQGWLSNIHLGACNPSDGSFVMVGKTFKGMTDEMLRWQTNRFRELAVRDDGRVVTVRPEQVVEVAIDGVQTSRRYEGGVALRFARVVRYRDDKGPADADTIDAVRAMR